MKAIGWFGNLSTILCVVHRRKGFRLSSFDLVRATMTTALEVRLALFTIWARDKNPDMHSGGTGLWILRTMPLDLKMKALNSSSTTLNFSSSC
jgi:hypothetical protein